jgi:hypothetical protein
MIISSEQESEQEFQNQNISLLLPVRLGTCRFESHAVAFPLHGVDETTGYNSKKLNSARKSIHQVMLT